MAETLVLYCYFEPPSTPKELENHVVKDFLQLLLRGDMANHGDGCKA
jgi:hypothetical protein